VLNFLATETSNQDSNAGQFVVPFVPVLSSPKQTSFNPGDVLLSGLVLDVQKPSLPGLEPRTNFDFRYF
jgi:hypothetical protein